MAVTFLIGDVRAKLRELAADTFDTVITSPPYWGLRDYGVAGQIGLEPTLGEHLDVMVEVFREVRRVLKPAGTLWLNYGDCYATTPNGRSAADTKAAATDDRTFRDKPFSTVGGVLKPKDLCMIPNRLAIALQEDGWWVRSEIIWGKPNPMPDSSGLYRPSVAHEKIFLLTKSDEGGFYVARDTHEISMAPDLSERCLAVTTGQPIARWIELGHYFNADAVMQARTGDEDAASYRAGYCIGGASSSRNVIGNRKIKKPDGWDTGTGGHGSIHRDGREAGETIEAPSRVGRYLRNYEPAALPVWEFYSRGFKGAHFATFPPEFVERCLLAGCPRGGAVLDPFGGSGTTGLVADRLGYDATLIDLNPAYVEDIAQVRLHKRQPKGADGPLFEAR